MGKKERRVSKTTARPAAEEARFRPRLKAKKRPAGADRDQPKEIAVFDPDAIEKVLDVLPTKAEAGRLADRISGLASASRIEALIALQAAELCVGDVSAVLGLSMSATSTMLKHLRGLGLVSVRHAGKQTYYKLRDNRVNVLLEFARSPAADPVDDEG
jgi:DNA-binding transcriptional ArsR family regulator